MGTAFANSISPILLKGLVGWWKMDEGSGTLTRDSSIASNNGTLVNSPIWTPGRVKGSSLKFDNSTNYVEIGNPSNLEIYNTFTMSAWIYGATTTGSNQFILTKDSPTSGSRGFGFGVSATGFVQVTISGTARLGTTAPSIVGNSWFHILVIRAGSWIVYVNGVLIGSFGAIPITNANSHWCIGAIQTQAGGAFQGFNGVIDDVRIYNRALTLAEIALLYQSGT